MLAPTNVAPLGFSQNAVVAGWLNVFEAVILAICFGFLANLKHRLIIAPRSGHKRYLWTEFYLFVALCGWQVWSAFQTYAMDAAQATHVRLWLRFAFRMPVILVAVYAIIYLSAEEAHMITTLRDSEYETQERKISRRSLRALIDWWDAVQLDNLRDLAHRLKGGRDGATSSGVGRS